MLLDLHHDADVESRNFDVCIIGAGAAGITTARELMRAGHEVCLAESGGLDFETKTQALYAGDNVGLPYYDLVDSRLRFFGGTVSIWGGRCARLDAIDFAKRDWVPHSGWPIDRDTLMPWYRKAEDVYEIGEFDCGDPYNLCGIVDQGFDPDVLATEIWRFDEANERFGVARSRDLINAPNLTILLHANAVHVQVSDNGKHVEHVEFRTLGGSNAKVRATHFVIACGAIENARLLLASDDVMTSGIGNAHDQLGRFFMEHPVGRVGKVVTDQPFDLWNAYRKRYLAKGVPAAPVLRLADAMQEREGALNSAITLKLQRPPEKGVALGNQLYHSIKHKLKPNQTGRALNRIYRGMRAWFHRVGRERLERTMVNMNMTGLNLIIRGEQAPNPDSRVILSDQRDALGQRQANLDWRMGAQDKHTARVIARTLDQELRRLGRGSIVPCDWLDDDGHGWPIDYTVGNHPIGGYHHMGGTRMGDDPKTSVVDANCTVHGISNLHVAGSSVFATAGWANPTFTITALGLRLADHLDRSLRRAN